MSTHPHDLRPKAEKLLAELQEIGEFRRGSFNQVYRQCGKPNCVCNDPRHPGHGPQTTLTYKVGGQSRLRNLPTAEAAQLVREQIANHARFKAWSREWQALNEEEADQRLEETLTGASAQGSAAEKKFRKRSKKRSRRKSSV